MNRKAGEELIGTGGLVVGLFLGLTLLRLPITGSWGQGVGPVLWQVVGVGAVLLPALGIGWALAAFERLGRLSSTRAAALGAGLVLLLPYGIGIATGPGIPADYATWGPTQKLVGTLPTVLVRGVHSAVGTAGGVLVGLFALSALGVLTMGWHPLVVLRSRETRDANRETGNDKRETKRPMERAPQQGEPPSAFPVS